MFYKKSNKKISKKKKEEKEKQFQSFHFQNLNIFVSVFFVIFLWNLLASFSSFFTPPPQFLNQNLKSI